MGIFSKKQPPAPPPPPAAGPRDIPPLYPAFYEKALVDAGKPVTPGNIVALANLTTANLALNAHQWMDAIGTPDDKARWAQRFSTDEPDLDGLVRRPDAMIDYLWAWTPRIHRVLREVMVKLPETLREAPRKYGDELPFDMWCAKS